MRSLISAPLYTNGEGGIKQDLIRALRWFRLAAAQGHEPAKAAVPQVEAMLKASLGDTTSEAASCLGS